MIFDHQIDKRLKKLKKSTKKILENKLLVELFINKIIDCDV